MKRETICKTFLISVVASAIMFTGCGGGGATTVTDDVNSMVTQVDNNTTNNNTTDNDPIQTEPVFSDSVLDVIDIEENQLNITSIQASSDISSLTYAIDGGEDQVLFAIDANTGVLKFSHFVPDYELPSDTNKDNDYNVIVSATDTASNKVTKSLIIRVTNDGTDDISGAAVVLKTGVNDGPNGSGYGYERDTATGLTWEDSAHVNENVTWEEAVNYCAAQSKRLPTRKELFTLVNYSQYPAALIDVSFTNKNSGLFWTSTNLLRGASEVNTRAWAIDFKFGGDAPYEKTSKDGMHVRCVTGAATFSSGGSFENLGDTIRDNVTGLIWENNKTTTLQKLGWDAAVERCKAKGSDWRLPNINELHTIMPENEMNTLLVNIIGDQPYSTDPLWSSTPVPGNPNQVLYIGNFEVSETEFNDGIHLGDTQNNEQEGKENNTSIRSTCVRGGHL